MAFEGIGKRPHSGYADVDLETVWDVVRHDLPAIQNQLRSQNAHGPEPEE